jgi:hypothetical protein
MWCSPPNGKITFPLLVGTDSAIAMQFAAGDIWKH